MRKVSYDPQTYETINNRRYKYADACTFLIKVVGDKAKGIKLLDSAEKLKNLLADYKMTGSINKANFVEDLQIDMLYDEKEREAKFNAIL